MKFDNSKFNFIFAVVLTVIPLLFLMFFLYIYLNGLLSQFRRSDVSCIKRKKLQGKSLRIQ